MRILACLCAIAVAVGLLAGCIYELGTSPRVMESLMRQTVILADTGLPEEQLSPVVEMTCAYLRGNEAKFQYVYPDAQGVLRQCFNEHEQQHMADVQALFALCRHLALMILLLAPLLVLRGWRSVRKGVRAGLGIVGIALAVLIVWGCIDFTGLFVTFHHTFFDNDLWLMDYHRDLIIRLMPETFFVRYALLIGGVWLASLAVFRLLFRKDHRHAS